MTNDYNPHTQELISARGKEGRHREPCRSPRDCQATRTQESSHHSCLENATQRLSETNCETKDCNDLGLERDSDLDENEELGMTRQPRLFKSEPDSNRSGFSEWGTFKDSLRAPIHNWFTYPAGFSHKAVEHYLQLHSAVPQKTVIYDPFMGSGTTNIVAKLGGTRLSIQ